MDFISWQIVVFYRLARTVRLVSKVQGQVGAEPPRQQPRWRNSRRKQTLVGISAAVLMWWGLWGG